jgi:hypothetical protein
MGRGEMAAVIKLCRHKHRCIPPSASLQVNLCLSFQLYIPPSVSLQVYARNVSLQVYPSKCISPSLWTLRVRLTSGEYDRHLESTTNIWRVRQTSREYDTPESMTNIWGVRQTSREYDKHLERRDLFYALLSLPHLLPYPIAGDGPRSCQTEWFLPNTHARLLQSGRQHDDYMCEGLRLEDDACVSSSPACVSSSPGSVIMSRCMSYGSG